MSVIRVFPRFFFSRGAKCQQTHFKTHVKKGKLEIKIHATQAAVK